MSFQLVPLNVGIAPLISLQRPVILIGRHLDCDARIDHAKISRRHCCVAIAYDRIIVRDLGSRHGIRVNGRKVEEVRLEVGDEVAIGPLIFRLEGEGVGASNAPSPGSGSRPGPAAPGKPASSPAAAPGNFLLDDPDLDLIPLDDL
ncbi:MAG: FHA domain-containing protein [Isosphaeraceae bacterium]